MNAAEALGLFPARYGTTIVDFVGRPRLFFARRMTDPGSYADPYAFFAINVLLSSLAFVATQGVASEDATQTSMSEGVLLFAAIAVLHAVMAVGLGRVAGALLNERTDPFELLIAFCYTSVFYPLIAVAIAFAPSRDGDIDVGWAVQTCIVQIVALAYLLCAMARVSSLHGRRLIAFGTVTMAAFVILSGAGAIALLTLRSERRSQATYSVANLQPTALGTPLGSITLEVRNIGPSSAQLIGAPVGPKTSEWFDFGPNSDMKYSVQASDGVGKAAQLTPKTRYYFRYVAQHGGVTCWGETKSFVTTAE